MTDDDLIGQVAEASDEYLAKGVQKAENLNGSTVEPVYSARKMRCYSVTESELQQINLAIIGITAAFSLGSALLAFYLDAFKDTVLAENIPERAEAVIGYVQPVLLALGLGSWAFAGVLLLWRRNMIKLIKDESAQG